jgi:hypothetical protein
MNIDLDALTEEELIALNHRIVARLRFLREKRTHTHMLEFRVGERVIFQPSGRDPLTGTLIRYNQKTVTVITDAGEHWNVSPSLLRKTEAPEPAPHRPTGPAPKREN